MEETIALLNFSLDWNLDLEKDGGLIRIFDGDQLMLSSTEAATAHAFRSGCFLATYHGMAPEMIIEDSEVHRERYRDVSGLGAWPRRVKPTNQSGTRSA
jgi:hypothetical protein